MAKREEPPNFEDYLAELNRPTYKRRWLGANLSRAEFFRKPRVKIIRPPDTRPAQAVWLTRLVVLGIFFGILGLLTYLYLWSKDDILLGMIVAFLAVSFVALLALNDAKNIKFGDKDDDETTEN